MKKILVSFLFSVLCFGTSYASDLDSVEGSEYAESYSDSVDYDEDLGRLSTQCGCRTKATGPDGKRHSCYSSCNLTATSGHRLAIKKTRGKWRGVDTYKLAGHGSEHTCRKSINVEYAEDSSSGLQYPVQLSVGVHSRGPNGPGSGRGTIECKVEVNEVRLK